MAGLEDMQNTVVLDREQHIAPVMRCCCDLRSPALESAIIGCRLHRSPPGAGELGEPGEGIRYMHSAETRCRTSS